MINSIKTKIKNSLNKENPLEDLSRDEINVLLSKTGSTEDQLVYKLKSIYNDYREEKDIEILYKYAFVYENIINPKSGTAFTSEEYRSIEDNYERNKLNIFRDR